MNDKNDCTKANHQIIIALGLPRAQQNKRSTFSLPALLTFTPGNPLVGITPIMDWARCMLVASPAASMATAVLPSKADRQSPSMTASFSTAGVCGRAAKWASRGR